MLRHRLQTGDLASRSERNAALIRRLSEAFRDRHKEYTNVRILAANEDTLLATKSCDALHYLISCNRCLKASLSCNIQFTIGVLIHRTPEWTATQVCMIQHCGIDIC